MANIGCYPLERSVTTGRGATCGRRARAGTTLLWVHGSPGDLCGSTRAGATHGSHMGAGTGATPTDGQSGEGSNDVEEIRHEVRVSRWGLPQEVPSLYS